MIVVRKQLRKQKSDTRENPLFQNEKRSLLLLNSRKHPHIIPFFGAYRYGQDLCFLFPVLEMDLEQFFQRDRFFGDFKWDSTFVAALWGLSSALCHVHDVRLQLDTEGVDFLGIGYHHDLRPANILVTEKTFVLADFGMGRLKSADETSQTPWKVGAGDYIAPECMDNELLHQDVGRGIDVWAFGCLVAEVVTFMRAGSPGLRDFSKARLSPGSLANMESTYFYNNEGRMKSVVEDWFVELSLACAQPPLDRFLLDLAFGILVPPLRRPKIADASRRLSFLNVKAHQEAALESFDRFLRERSSESKTSQDYTKVLVARQRLKIFGKASGLDGTESQHTRPEQLDLPSNNKERVALLRQIFNTLQILARRNNRDSRARGSATTIEDVARFEAPQALPDPKLSLLLGDAATLVAEIQKRVQELWALLPENVQLQEAESDWADDTMLRQDRSDPLTDPRQSLRSVASDVRQREDSGFTVDERRSQGMSSSTDEGYVESAQTTGFAASQLSLPLVHRSRGHSESARYVIEHMY